MRPARIFFLFNCQTPEILTVNPTGYQYVLYATIVLYVIALLVCFLLVRPTDKALEAKKAKAK